MMSCKLLKKMIILIPLGGLGTRFHNVDYKLPKPLINVLGKPIINWLLDNLVITKNMLICIPYNKMLAKYNFESKLKKDYPHIRFFFHQMQDNTEGAAQTIALALDKLENQVDSPIISLDGDTFYYIDVINKWNGENKVFVFDDVSSKTCYSYVQTCDNGIIVDIAEKCKISNYACSGAYGFNSWKLLRQMCHTIVNQNCRTNNEYYISNVIKLMVSKYEYIFQSQPIARDDFVCLGTPFDVRLFCANYKQLSLKSTVNNHPLCKPRRFCFDLDNTLVSYPKVANDYTTVEPIPRVIALVRQLKSRGHSIIIHTARRMKTHNGNCGKVLTDIGKVTFDTLERFDIPYDEIHFGKPYADFYIDDLAVSAFEALDKSLGFYNDNNFSTRDFNELKSFTMDIFRKCSHDLSGEIHYYSNIPEIVKKYFPVMLDFDSCNSTWYDVERINGVTLSKLYVTESLSTKQLKSTMQAVQRIHDSNSTIAADDVNIYANCANKLKERVALFDYLKFCPASSDIIHKLMNHHCVYETQNRGLKCVIHGDPVFTNIILDKDENLKFIDMRGKLDDKLTIFGDALYDWAKMYQSLIGYDEIIEAKSVSNTYKETMVECFENTLKNENGITSEQFADIKVITKSLLLTLIPLHATNEQNSQCYDFYHLINSKYLS